MEVKVNDRVIKKLIADHMSNMCGKYIAPKNVHLYYDCMCEAVTHAYTHIDDDPFIHTPNCKYFMVRWGKSYCNPGDNREGDCVLLTGAKECSYRKE